MAKILLAVVAALCAFAAAAGLPAPAQAGGSQLQHTEPAMAVPGWPNPTEILKAIEEVLQAIQDKIQEVSDEAEDAVKIALKKIEEAALEAARKWNALLQEWVDKANQAGVDIRECVDGQNRTLADVAESLQEDAEQCLADPILELFRVIKNLKEKVPEAKALLQEAVDKAIECSNKGNALEVVACFAGSMPVYQVRAATLMARTMLEAGLAAAKAAAIAPSASLCTAVASARRGAEATAIIDATISCIKGKLNPTLALQAL